jgi:hypothetical protein
VTPRWYARTSLARRQWLVTRCVFCGDPRHPGGTWWSVRGQAWTAVCLDCVKTIPEGGHRAGHHDHEEER